MSTAPDTEPTVGATQEERADIPPPRRPTHDTTGTATGSTSSRSSRQPAASASTAEQQPDNTGGSPREVASIGAGIGLLIIGAVAWHIAGVFGLIGMAGIGLAAFAVWLAARTKRGGTGRRSGPQSGARSGGTGRMRMPGLSRSARRSGANPGRGAGTRSGRFGVRRRSTGSGTPGLGSGTRAAARSGTQRGAAKGSAGGASAPRRAAGRLGFGGGTGASRSRLRPGPGASGGTGRRSLLRGRGGAGARSGAPAAGRAGGRLRSGAGGRAASVRRGIAGRLGSARTRLSSRRAQNPGRPGRANGQRRPWRFGWITRLNLLRRLRWPRRGQNTPGPTAPPLVPAAANPAATGTRPAIPLPGRHVQAPTSTDSKENTVAGHAAIDAAAEAISTNIGGFHPDNHEDLDQFLQALPHLWETAAQAFVDLAGHFSEKMPLDAAVHSHLAEMGSSAQALVEWASEAANLYRNSHTSEIERIESPRSGEEFWDVTQQ